MRMNSKQIKLTLLIFITGLHCAAAGQKPLPMVEDPVFGIKSSQLAPGILLDTRNRRLFIEARVCLDSGILEFLLVQGEQKAYESVLTTGALPSQVMAGLLLMNYKKGEDITISLYLDKTPLPLSSLVTRRGKKTAEPPKWYFAGSRFAETEPGKSEFVADLEGILLSLLSNEEGVIHIKGDAGDPYKDDNFGFKINTGKAPKKGAAVTVVISRPGPAGK